jgi:hypothetical protein
MHESHFLRGCALSLCLLAEQSSFPAPNPSSNPLAGHLADYDAELRLPNGREDVDTMVARLKDLGVSTYYWLVWHAATDWDDLKLFLPKAAKVGLNVWVYLVPPSESTPGVDPYSEPFRQDYQRWGEEIGRLSLQSTNLTGWVIDDFYANRRFFTPTYVREMRSRAQRINPRLSFLPLMYFGEITREFVESYREVIDGVVVAYPNDRQEIDTAWAILNDRATATAGVLSYPADTPSKPGDFVSVSITAEVTPGDRHVIYFREQDDFTGPTSGYHFKQVLVDDTVVWEEDAAGGKAGWQEHSVDIGDLVRSAKTKLTLTLRLLDNKGVSNFGLRWRLGSLQAEGLRLGATLSEPRKWNVQRRGSFQAGFGEFLGDGKGDFHVPFVVMTAANPSEFQQRHGEPASPERIAQWFEMCLQAQRDGKCDGVVTYCLDKGINSPVYPLARKLFRVRTVEGK